MVSYLENVDKLMELHKSSGDAQAIRHMVEMTFPGRRHEITTGTFDGTDDIIQKRCPFLRQPSYVSASCLLDGNVITLMVILLTNSYFY